MNCDDPLPAQHLDEEGHHRESAGESGVRAVSQGQACKPGTGTALGVQADLPACLGVGGWAVRAVRGSKMTSYYPPQGEI